jgi:hypothetical protein
MFNKIHTERTQTFNRNRQRCQNTDYIKKYNNMNCNYDCDESPSLSSNDCLMKDVTVLICAGVDGLSISVSFSSINEKDQIRIIVIYQGGAGTIENQLY